MIDGANLSATHGIKNLLPLKEEKAAVRDDNKKSRRTQYVLQRLTCSESSRCH
jgi:hypothetical protein